MSKLDDRVYPNQIWPQNYWWYHPYNDYQDVLRTWEATELRDANPNNWDRMKERHHYDMRVEAVNRANNGEFTQTVQMDVAKNHQEYCAD